MYDRGIRGAVLVVEGDAIYSDYDLSSQRMAGRVQGVKQGEGVL